MHIVRDSHMATERISSHYFEDVECPGAGWQFPCDKNGNIVVTDENRDNVENCQNGVFEVIDRGLKVSEYTCWVPAIGICSCGHQMPLGSFTNTCDSCGRDYDMSGNQLAPRSQWGEETGESLGEILAA